MPSLNGAVVLVTGANGGIGSDFVHQALARGAAKVYATARTPRTWADERTVPLTLDITDAESTAAAVAEAPDVTALINNAGANPPSASLLEVTEVDIRANMETNFFGPVFLARAFAPILPSRSPFSWTCTQLRAGMGSSVSTAQPRPRSGRPPTLCGLSSHPGAST